MKREEFMRKLEFLLQDIKEEEKEDALQYYRDYLEDAGPEKEEEVIREFGSPERIAAIIRAEISGNLKEGGEFTETGYGDERFKEPNFQLQKRTDGSEQKKQEEEQKQKEKEDRREKPDFRASEKEKKPGGRGRLHPALKWGLAILCLLVFGPPVLKMGAGAAGMVIKSIVGICMLFLCIGIVAACLILGGVALGVFGLITLFGEVFPGLMFIGLGLIAIGCGFFALILSAWFYGTAVPWIFSRAKDMCQRISNRERRAGI